MKGDEVTLKRIVRSTATGEVIRESEWPFRWWHPGDVWISLRIWVARQRYLKEHST